MTALRKYGERFCVLRSKEEGAPQELVRALREADALNPWVMFYRLTGEKAPSIKGEIQIGDVHEGSASYERMLTFKPAFNLQRSQLYAYETYVRKLAYMLANKEIPGVRGVYARIVHETGTIGWGSPLGFQQTKLTPEKRVGAVFYGLREGYPPGKFLIDYMRDDQMGRASIGAPRHIVDALAGVPVGARIEMRWQTFPQGPSMDQLVEVRPVAASHS